MPSLLTLTGVALTFGERRNQPAVEAVTGVDLRVESGESLVLVGPSGSGKTTLLKVMAGLLRVTAGEVRFDGRDLSALSEADRSKLRSQEMSFVFQDYNLLPYLTSTENVKVAAMMRGVPDQAITEVLDLVGVSHRAHAYPSELSGGEQQRVSIARALIGNPRVLFADEPTGALDAVNRDVILDLFDHATQSGMALVIVTHDDTVAQRFTRRLELAAGSTPRERSGEHP